MESLKPFLKLKKTLIASISASKLSAAKQPNY